MVGHGCFCNVEHINNSDEWWNDTLDYQILPYLKDICSDDKDTYTELEHILKEDVY